MATLMLDDQIRRNKYATVRLFIAVFAILAMMIFAIGVVLGYPPYVTLFMALVIGGIYLAIASASGTSAILKSARARPANPAIREEKLLLYKVEELCIAAQIPMPKVYVQEDDDINAFATGKDPAHGIICVTSTALRELDQEELEGVLAHELAHIKNYDIRVTLYAIALIGLIAMLAEIVFRSMFFGGGRNRGGGKEGGAAMLIVFLIALVFMILAPILSKMVYFAISRKREFLADATGAHLSRNPDGLARALEKIGARQPNPHHGDKTVASLYFDNPFRKLGRRERSSVWSSHPPIEERIRRLRGQG
ncbi:MAG: M48 family metallopeptidase [Candidatus Thermoplasmatota archaeon]|jgi:heat shock protein HtpX